MKEFFISIHFIQWLLSFIIINFPSFHQKFKEIELFLSFHDVGTLQLIEFNYYYYQLIELIGINF